ncbi:MAG TPA: nitroreductase family protein [Dehalococcoidia bacterium]|jgi:nitroreductase|nr:nitroreductase family protein [Dehalococcoidia bacterium]
MDLYEVMRTTFSARQFTDDPVPDEVLYRIFDSARFASSGGNRQGWRVIVVREPATKAALAELQSPAIKRYLAQVRAGENPYNTVVPSAVDEDTVARTPVPPATLDVLRKAPVVLVVCVDLAVVASIDRDLPRVGVISGASIYPFVWNVLLAARNEGFGGTLTTWAVGQEDGIRELLGVPSRFAVAAVIPFGRPVHQLTRLRRKPVSEFAMLERWDGPRLARPGQS